MAAILIPEYNGADPELLKSIPDGGLTIYRNVDKEGRGFTWNVNFLLRQALEKKHNYYIIVNEDVAFEPGAIGALLQGAALHPEAGILSPQQVLWDQPDRIFYGGSGELLTGFHRAGIRGRHWTEPEYQIWANFGCVLIRREVFRDIGLLDENMKFIFSDSDFSLRARAAGWKILYWPKAVVRHRVGQSVNPKEERVREMMKMDRLYFEAKWLTGRLFLELNKEVFDPVVTRRVKR